MIPVKVVDAACARPRPRYQLEILGENVIDEIEIWGASRWFLLEFLDFWLRPLLLDAAVIEYHW